MSRVGREASASMSRCARHVARPRPDHVAAHDRGQLRRPHEARRQPVVGRDEERRPEQVPALLERVGHGDDHVLAVDQQVREVVGDEVADGDRQQPGPDRARRSPAAPTASAAPVTIASQPSSSSVFGHEARRAEHRREGDGLRQAVEDDRRRRRPRTSATSAIAHGPREEPGRERAPLDDASRRRRPGPRSSPASACGRGHDAERREPVERPEPDGERLALRPATRRARTGP